MSHLLEVRDVHGGYHKTEIVHGVSFTVEHGEFVCIIGANGCGKTTTLKTVLGLMKPTAGEVLIDGKSTHDMNEPELARHFAYIPQAHTPPFPFNVADVVLMGRTPYVNRLAVVKPDDRAIAWRAMKQMSIEHLADRPYTALSGGQQQLVLIARALTQEPDLLVMDEPTASLDFGNQLLVLNCARELACEGYTVIQTTHNPEQSFMFSDRILALRDGRVLTEGRPRDVLTSDMMRRLYGVEVEVSSLFDDRARVCTPASIARGE